MRQAVSKFTHEESSRGSGLEIALVAAAILSALTTVAYGVAVVFQGGLVPTP
jgi:hypothetical protein